MGTGNKRCKNPECYNIGSPKLDGYCRPCDNKINPGMDLDRFLDEFFRLTENYIELGQKALLEIEPIGVPKQAKDVRPMYRKKALNIVERRIPVGVQNYIVQDQSPMESAGWSYFEEPDSYGIEKEHYEIE